MAQEKIHEIACQILDLACAQYGDLMEVTTALLQVKEAAQQLQLLTPQGGEIHDYAEQIEAAACQQYQTLAEAQAALLAIKAAATMIKNATEK